MKNQIRKEIKEKRRNLGESQVDEKSLKAAENFLESDIYKSAKVLMVYMPLGKETDTTEIIKQAFIDKKRLVLPTTNRETGEITPCYFDEGTVLKKGGFSVREPQSGEPMDKHLIDVVLVPGIAFDKKGARVGFGKGCYDMFLCGMKAIKVGYCYDFQVVDEIPADEHDIMMDFVVADKWYK